jgi:hypothetical protein
MDSNKGESVPFSKQKLMEWHTGTICQTKYFALKEKNVSQPKGLGS